MTPTSTTAAASAPPLSQAISELLSALSGGVPDPDARLRLWVRTIDGIGAGELCLPVRPRAGLVDVPVLELLEAGCLSAHVALAVFDANAQAATIRLHALVVSWVFKSVYRESAWRPPADALAAAQKRLEQFSIQPATLIIGGGPLHGSGFSLTGLFPLSQPIDVRGAADQDRALELLRRLARALGADVPADDCRLADLALPVPGTVIRELISRRLIVRCLVCEPDRVSPLDRIEAAIQKESKA